MIRMCAKCRKELGRDEREPLAAVTHGLCRQCVRETLAEYGFDTGKEQDSFAVAEASDAADVLDCGGRP